MKEGVSLISKDLQGKTRGAIPFVIRGICVSVAKVEMRGDVAGDLALESKKWELVMGGTYKVGWFKGGPEHLEKESHEFLSSKRDDRCSNPLFEMVPKTCQGSFFVPALA